MYFPTSGYLTYFNFLMIEGSSAASSPTTIGVIRFRNEEAAPISNIKLELSRDSCVRMTKTSSASVSARLIFVEMTSRSEEHTSELQSRPHLVCRLLLEKKKITSTC